MFLGKISIALAAVFAVMATIAFVYVGRGRQALARTGRKFYYIFAAFTCVAAAYLMYLFVTNDFRVEYVYSYSALGDGLIYNIAGYWGGQQGTFQLWLAMAGDQEDVLSLAVLVAAEGPEFWRLKVTRHFLGLQLH